MSNDIQNIQKKIYVIRGQRVMLDRDLADLYGVKTGRLNEQVKRNMERFPEDFMFQLNREEFTFLKQSLLFPDGFSNEELISQNATSNSSENQLDENWKSQNATSNSVKMGLRKLPYAFTENGVAMLSSVLRSPLAIQVNIGIMRAFVAFRHMSAALPAPSADVVQLRKDFEELKQDIEDILHDQNEINEETRAQLDAINDALTQLQGQKPASDQLPEIGYTAIQKQREKSQNYPPQLTKLNNNNKSFRSAKLALLHMASRRMSRVFLCLCLMAFTFFFASCQQEEVRTTGMQQLYQESQTLNQASLDSIDHYIAKLGKYINSHLAVLDDELYDPLISNVRKAYALHGYKAEVTMNVGIKINTDWEGIKFYSYDKDGNLTLDSVYTKEQLDSLGINKGVIDLRDYNPNLNPNLNE